MSFYCFPIKNVSETIGNTVPKAQSSLRTIISTVQISLLFSDTPLAVGCLQMFSVIRGLSPSRKSEKRVFYEIRSMDKRGVPFTIELHPPGEQQQICANLRNIYMRCQYFVLPCRTSSGAFVNSLFIILHPGFVLSLLSLASRIELRFLA